MADGKPGWIDYVNLGLTTGIGIIGIYVAVNLGSSANQLSQNGLIVASATLLLDDSPVRQQGGVQIVFWLKQSKVELPPWEWQLIKRVATQSNSSAPTQNATGDQTPAPVPVATPAPPPPPPLPASTAPQITSEQVANQLFSVIGGSIARLFIQYPDAAQTDCVEALRVSISEKESNGQSIVVPRIQLIQHPPDKLQLRFLKQTDKNEAADLAMTLKSILGVDVPLVDKSATYETRADVKPRTFELWFAHAPNGTNCVAL
jgi:hypothetical protein